MNKIQILSLTILNSKHKHLYNLLIFFFILLLFVFFISIQDNNTILCMKEEASENSVLTTTDYIKILEERCIVLEMEIKKLKESHNNLLQHYTSSQINYYELSQHDHSLQQTNSQLRTLLNLQQQSIEELIDRYRIVEEQNRQVSILLAELSKPK